MASAHLLLDHLSDTGDTLLIAVRCEVGDIHVKVNALLDCAAEWSVLNRDVAEVLGLLDFPGDMEMTLLTRFGRLEGTLIPAELTFVAADGENVTIEARWFVSEYWRGPTVLGWRGCLNLIRFALNPDEDRLYFAAAEGRAA